MTLARIFAVIPLDIYPHYLRRLRIFVRKSGLPRPSAITHTQRPYMKFGIRTLFATAAGVALLAAASSYWAGEQVGRDDKAAADARVATFMSYRLAQSLKALAAGHELTMNEFYSTVLEFPAYQKKSAAQKAAIESELAVLVDL